MIYWDMEGPKTFNKPYGELSLLDFQDQFPDEKACWDYLIKSDGPRVRDVASAKVTKWVCSDPKTFSMQKMF